ncbi:MAG: VOC family protein [Dehalococcoidia bacterium]
MSRVLCVHHINLEVKDLERAKKWWLDVLGCDPLDRGPGIGVVKNQLFLGESEVHFTAKGEQAVVPPHGHPALEIRDWNEMIQHLEKLGIPYYDAPSKDQRGQARRPDGSFATFVVDSEGTTIELTHHPTGRRWARDDVNISPS